MTSSSVGPSKKKPGGHRRTPISITIAHHRLIAICVVLLFASTSASLHSTAHQGVGTRPESPKAAWLDVVGDFQQQNSSEVVIVLERLGHLVLREANGTERLLHERDENSFYYDTDNPDLKGVVTFVGDEGPSFLLLTPAGAYRRLPYAGSAQKLELPRPIADLRREALAAMPPQEKGPFRKPDLVELASLDAAIHLDIRYATENDFLGLPVYTQPRAFLQRPAAEALLRVLHKLQPLGYGLLVHDGYRPWYVTKIFWDATPPEGKIFVADPGQGSRHNRGCAVDLTLYDLKTGQPVEMTGGYDEMSPRSFPNYPGGTSLQRWHRDLLRRAMESEGFSVYDSEWWHFDHKDWREYGILNIPFEKLGIGSPAK